MENFPQNPESSLNEQSQNKGPILTSPNITELKGRKWVPTLAILLALFGVYLSLAKYQNWRPFGREFLEQGLYSNKEKPDTSSWQTYRSEEYGFEFEYPKDWKITDNSHTKGFPEEGIETRQWVLVLIESPNRYDLQGYQNASVSYRILISDADNIRKLSYIAGFGGEQPAQSLWNLSVPKMVEETTVEYKIGNQILSTFRFIK